MEGPKCIGVISAQQSKGSRIFGFEYDKNWLKSDQVFLLDPEIGLYAGIHTNVWFKHTGRLTSIVETNSV